MKERLNRNKARLTEADERKIWQAITDERTKTNKAGPAWTRFRIPAFAGAAAVAVLLAVTYLGQSPGDRTAIQELATPRAQRMDGVLDRAAPETTRTEAVFHEEETMKDVAEAAPGTEAPIEKRRKAPKGEPASEASAPKAAIVNEKRAVDHDAASSGGRAGLMKEKETGTQEASVSARANLVDGKSPGTRDVTIQENELKASTPAPLSTKKGGRVDGVAKTFEEAKGAPEPTLGEPRRMAVTSKMLAEPMTDTAGLSKGPLVSNLTAPTQKKTGSLSGTLRDALSKKPIEGARVEILGTMHRTLTRPNGTFALWKVPAGTYTVRVSMIGYAERDYGGVTIEEGKVAALHAELGTSRSEPETIGVDGVREKLESKKDLDGRSPLRALGYLAESPTGLPGATLHKRGGRAEATQFLSAGPADGSGWPISVGGTDPVNGHAFDAMFFEHYGVNPFIDPEEDSLSTFAVDVDRASYTLTRSYLYRNALPRKEGVRVEEFVNAFTHGYEPPKKDAFGIHLDAAPSPFGDGYVLLRVGLKGREIDVKDRKPAVLTFVIDVSGSMNREDRLELVKWSLLYLLDEMTGDDRIGIVVYGSQARVVLEPTAASDRRTIEKAIASLKPEGSTNAEAGLRVGYEMAARAFRKDAINRVILCSDGVANVGRTGADSILERIEGEASKGIEITAVGFGMGNYNDVLMESLADKGDGNYYYVDVTNEAKRVFQENLTGTLQTIAKEVKVQVEFEPGTVRRYRLLGYENRDVKDEDFRNDRVDAGEIGAGHEVTALFEVKLEREPKGKRLAVVRVRHEDPESGKVTERSESIGIGDVGDSIEKADPTFRIDAAVAEFAEILRKSYWARESKLDSVYRLARDAAHDLAESAEADELLDLIDRADRLMAKEAEWWKEDAGDEYRPAWERDDENAQ